MLEARRTLVKSPPELWAELSDPESLAKHLEAFGEIRITRLDPESTVAWEGDRARGTVELSASGWGTKVTLTAETVEEGRRSSSPSRRPMVAPPPEAPPEEEPADGPVEEPEAVAPPEPEPPRARSRSRSSRSPKRSPLRRSRPRPRRRRSAASSPGCSAGRSRKSCAGRRPSPVAELAPPTEEPEVVAGRSPHVAAEEPPLAEPEVVAECVARGGARGRAAPAQEVVVDEPAGEIRVSRLRRRRGAERPRRGARRARVGAPPAVQPLAPSVLHAIRAASERLETPSLR